MSGSRVPFVRLGYLAVIQSGITVDANRDHGSDSVTLPYLRVANVQDGHLDLGTITEIRVPRAVARSAMLRRGDVLMTEGGDLDKLGRGTVWNGEIENCLHQNHVFAVRPERGRLMPEYLALITQTAYARAYFESTGTKTTNLALTSSSKIRNFRIPFVDLDEQCRIISFLGVETARIDRMARLRTSQMEALGARYQSHLSEVAQRLCDRYGYVKVRHVLQKIEQGWSPQCEDRHVKDGEWGVIKAGCVNGGIFDVTQHKALPAGTAPELRYRLRAGDLLMSRASGSIDMIGSIAVLPDDLPDQLLLCDKVYRMRMNRMRMIPHFVAFMLRTFQVREQIKLGISGAEGMANNLPTATVTNLPLPDVPLGEQTPIVDDLNEAWWAAQETIQKLGEQLSVLSERRQALITAAVTGRTSL